MLGLALVILLGMVLTLGGVTALLILWGGAEIAVRGRRTEGPVNDLIQRLREAAARKRTFWADPVLSEETASVAMHRAEADLMEEAADALERAEEARIELAAVCVTPGTPCQHDAWPSVTNPADRECLWKALRLLRAVQR